MNESTIPVKGVTKTAKKVYDIDDDIIKFAFIKCLQHISHPTMQTPMSLPFLRYKTTFQ